jgi:hypothetical protein
MCWPVKVSAAVVSLKQLSAAKQHHACRHARAGSDADVVASNYRCTDNQAACSSGLCRSEQQSSIMPAGMQGLAVTQMWWLPTIDVQITKQPAVAAYVDLLQAAFCLSCYWLSAPADMRR